jgi:hypothetical protein
LVCGDSEIESRGGRVDRIDGADTVQTVDHALSLLSECLDVRRGIVEPFIMQRKDYKNLLQLGYYANQLLFVFFREAMVTCAITGTSVGEERREDCSGLTG